jgi:hypothetical protein
MDARGQPLAPGRPRRRRRVILAALGIVAAAAAVYALVPDSTVREGAPARAPTAPSRAPKKGPSPTDRHRKTVGPTKKTTRHSTGPGVPTPTRATPNRPSPFPTRTFIWPGVPHATLYKVEFFRRGRETFERLSSKPRLELPLHWVYQGRRYRLTAGIYSWRVSPAFGPRSRLRYGMPIVRSTWVARY